MKSWYAIYTKSRAEKKVKAELDFQGIECYLPMQQKLRQWSDRKKWVEMPLISGYIFVCITPKEYDKVLQTDHVVTYVRFEGKAAVIPNEQIEAIRLMLRDTQSEIEVNPGLFNESDPIEVIGGPLIGLKGELITIKGKKRVAVQLQQLNLALTVDLPLNEIRKIT